MESDDFFRFGPKIVPKILNKLGVKDIEQSRIDGKFIIKVNYLNQPQLIDNLKKYFQLYLISISLNDHIPIIPNNFLKKNKHELWLKIDDFYEDNWRTIYYLQKTRKEKLKKIELCQKSS
jgi:hypothetical protein